MNDDWNIDITRVYDAPGPTDARRILVDRLWPRGLSKGTAQLDEWCKEIAPSTSLRQWYGHCLTRFEEFRIRYLAELDDSRHAEVLAHLRALTIGSRVTLLTASKELGTSHARVLADRLASGRWQQPTPMTGPQ